MPSDLIRDELYQKVLLEPSKLDVNNLYIVSGYASSAMAFHHAESLKAINSNVFVHLIVGMVGKDGLSVANHRAFQKLMNYDLSGRFECSYLIERPAVHSKVYAWTDNSKSVSGFTGSANYSQQAFIGNRQREIITNCNPTDAFDYYQHLISDTIYCTDKGAEELIALNSGTRVYSPSLSSKAKTEPLIQKQSSENLSHIKCSFINKSREVSQSSGLNWGQRKGREPNQAYISLTIEICSSNFFPPRATHFTVNTDDGQIMICTRAQDNGKAIQTPHNNSLLGEYFRKRLGVPLSEPVKMEHLLKYGRTDIDFYKIDDENYYMDFSV